MEIWGAISDFFLSVVSPIPAWDFWDWVTYLGSLCAVILALRGIMRAAGNILSKLVFQILMKHSPRFAKHNLQLAIQEMHAAITIYNPSHMLFFGFGAIAEALLWYSGTLILYITLPSPLNMASAILFIRAVLLLLSLRITTQIAKSPTKAVTRKMNRAKTFFHFLKEEEKHEIEDGFLNLLHAAKRYENQLKTNIEDNNDKQLELPFK